MQNLQKLIWLQQFPEYSHDYDPKNLITMGKFRISEHTERWCSLVLYNLYHLERFRFIVFEERKKSIPQMMNITADGAGGGKW